jgi:hypothetical protein
MSFSYWLMIARIVSKHVVELNVINLVVSLSLEPLEDDLIFFFGNLELHRVKDGSEASVGNEAALALILVLEEGLNEEALVADEPAEALEAGIEDLFFVSRKLMLRIKDRGSLEVDGLFKGVLLEILHSENLLKDFVDSNIVNFSSIPSYSEFFLKNFELFVSEIDLLSIEDTSELLRSDGTLSKKIVVLEELAQADAVLLHLRLQLKDELVKLSSTLEGVDLAHVLGLSHFLAGA